MNIIFWFYLPFWYSHRMWKKTRNDNRWHRWISDRNVIKWPRHAISKTFKWVWIVVCTKKGQKPMDNGNYNAKNQNTHPGHMRGGFSHRGSQLYFHITRYVLTFNTYLVMWKYNCEHLWVQSVHRSGPESQEGACESLKGQLNK